MRKGPKYKGHEIKSRHSLTGQREGWFSPPLHLIFGDASLRATAGKDSRGQYTGCLLFYFFTSLYHG